MQFGDKNSFAVELELDEEPYGVWLFGHFCYWINGVRVGDYELSTSLRDVLSGLRWVVHDRGNRGGGALCEIPLHEVFSCLDNALYGSEEAGSASDTLLPDEPARFEITVPVEVFNDWKVFLIECGEKAFVLLKSFSTGELQSVVIQSGLFDKAIDEAYRFLNVLHEGATTAEPNPY